MWVSDKLSQREKDEINIFDGIWFVGNASNDEIKHASNETDFDGEKGRYKWRLGDHINYRFDIFCQAFQNLELRIARFRYEIIKYLGGGTYGEVVKAFDHKYDSEVAIKIRVIYGLSREKVKNSGENLFESWNCDLNSDENRVIKCFRPDCSSQTNRPRSKISSSY